MADPVHRVAGADNARMYRWSLDPTTGRATEEPIDGRWLEFPTHNDNRTGREHRYLYAGGLPLPGKGFFIRPTIIDNPPDNARVVQEEQFGPVLPLLEFDDIEDAIVRADAGEYGLGLRLVGRRRRRPRRRLPSGGGHRMDQRDSAPHLERDLRRSQGLRYRLGERHRGTARLHSTTGNHRHTGNCLVVLNARPQLLRAVIPMRRCLIGITQTPSSRQATDMSLPAPPTPAT